MLMNATNVDKFHVKCNHAIDASRVYSWICATPLCNVRELDLSIPTRELEVELLRVLTSSTLVVLKLGRGFSLNVPASVSLPCLKILRLDSIEFLDHISIERLFSNCSVLEDLEIVGCTMDNIRVLNLSSSSLKRLTVDRKGNSRFCHFRLLLDAPSLIYLNYTICYGECYTLKNLHSLYEAHFSIATPLYHVPLPEFLKGISGIQSISLSRCGEANLMAFDKLSPLNDVTRLMLTCKPVLKLSVVMKLLHCFPNLEEFIFDGNIRDGYENVCDVPPCVSSRLKAIEWKAFYYMERFSDRHMLSANEEDVATLEYFLKNANVLEKMWVRIGCRRRFQPEMVEKLKTMVETVKKLSKTCDVKVLREKPFG